MTVTVKLFATFRTDRFAAEEREVVPGTRVRQLVDELGIEVGAIGVTMVNGRHVELDHELRQGEVLAIFPVIGGG
ncbi:MAG TPA: MoaD/ThiS family protein [Candidatus Limnocylindrales bacterium]|nr:MoaD/ThiS family protein [Candidatus Limnocylindrales bacterium]